MFRLYQLIIFSLLLIGCKNTDNNIELEKDSRNKIDSLFLLSTNKDIPYLKKTNLLEEAEKLINDVFNDSLRTNLKLQLAYKNYLIGNIENFKNINLSILDDSSLNLNPSHAALVNEYLGFYYQTMYVYDSAFYYYNNAFKNNKITHNRISEIRILLNMATIQSIEKDYVGSEINTIKALSKLKEIDNKKTTFYCYNNLAFISNQLNEFDKAIEYRKKSLMYLDKLSNSEDLFLIALNGIGMSYQKKEDYQNSINFFRQGLAIENVYQNFPETYALLIDNLAFSYLKTGKEQYLPNLFYKSLKIRDSLQNIGGLIMSNLHLAQYFLTKKDTITAKYHALKSKELAKESNGYIDLLESYLLLSKLESGEKGKIYLNNYIKLSDSLQQNEREIREKFTRIAYETDEITKEKAEIAKKNYWLTIVLIIGGAFFTVVYFYLRQRTKTRKLLFDKKQEEANIEIYNLMISEKTKFQEGSSKERIRISEELHDGIVNKLFGTRLSLSLINAGISDEEIEKWEEHIESLRELEEEIRTLSHELKVEVFNIDNTFEKMVEELVEKRSKLSNFKPDLSFKIVSDWDDISNNIKIHCYRTLQEALHNIHKYAKATQVKINFYEIDKVLYFEIIDNGVGFNPKNKTKGIGLKNIESRIKKLNGEVTFISSQDNGTEIRITIPLKN